LLGIESYLVNTSTIDYSNIDKCTEFYKMPGNQMEITAFKGSITVFHECVVSETVYPFPSNGLVLLVFTIFRVLIHGNRVSKLVGFQDCHKVTPCRKVFKKLIVAQFLKKFPAFNGT
jgi:uncharacterized protein YhhL (DUF1145 family)